MKIDGDKFMNTINYNDFIQNILNTRGRFACGDEYHERHHIVPKCCGGTNDKDNLIDLFAQEHLKISESHSGGKNPSAKQVIRLSDGKIYSCGKYAAMENQINYEIFKGKCRRHDEFMYYNEWLTEQNDYNNKEN